MGCLSFPSVIAQTGKEETTTGGLGAQVQSHQGSPQPGALQGLCSRRDGLACPSIPPCTSGICPQLFIAESLLRKAMSLALLFVKSSLVSQVCGGVLFCFITQPVSFGIHVLVRQILFFVCTPGLLLLQSALNVL